MVCSNCQKTIDDDSKFCQFCGAEVKETKPQKGDELWQAFTELSFEQDKDKRQRNHQLIPSSIREIIKRFSTNLFESLKEQNNSVLVLSYSTLEDIKNSYYFLAEDGFWVYFAKRKVEGQETPNLEGKDVEKLLEQWNDEFVKSKAKKKKVENDILEIIIASKNVQINQLLENHEELKKLPARVIEKIQADLTLMPYWVYGCCLLSEKE